MASEAISYHNPKCSTSHKMLELLRDSAIEPHFVITPKGTRLARPPDRVREIL